MNINTVSRLRRVAKRIRKLSAPRGLILLYHRVADSPPDPYALCVTPQHFTEHLEVLRKESQLIRLQQLASALKDGDRPQRAVALTFDDGYANNLYQAKPLLERYDAPATVFVTAGYIGSEREFWWDELDRLLLQPGTLPETLQLKINGDTFRWSLVEAECHAEKRVQRHQYGNRVVPDKNDLDLRLQCYRSLSHLLRSFPDAEKKKVLHELLDWAGQEPRLRPSHRALLPDEIVHLAEGGLIEIGAHTMTHPVLSTLPADVQREEIQRSKILLEEIVGRVVLSFAYPHGSWGDYTPETVSIVREVGFTCACSVLFDTIWRGTDCYRLPRVKVEDWDGDTFAKIIRWLLK